MYTNMFEKVLYVAPRNSNGRVDLLDKDAITASFSLGVGADSQITSDEAEQIFSYITNHNKINVVGNSRVLQNKRLFEGLSPAQEQLIANFASMLTKDRPIVHSLLNRIF